MYKAACAHGEHDNQDDDRRSTLAFVNFFLVQIFPKPNSSKFSTIKILCHMVLTINYITVLGQISEEKSFP